MIAIHRQESAPAFVLASFVASYPDGAFGENVRTLLEDKDLATGLGEAARASLAELGPRLGDALGNSALLDDLRSDFIDRFDRGKQATSLYETEYGRERAMVKGNELADIAGFYRAFGFETGGDGLLPEMVDHLAVELEFYALLLLKSQALVEAGDEEGAAIVLDARRKFLKDHLGRFIDALCGRPGLLESPFYTVAMRYCRDLIHDESHKLEVVLDPVEWLPGQTEPVEMSCGGAVGCLK